VNRVVAYGGDFDLILSKFRGSDGEMVMIARKFKRYGKRKCADDG
jgi:hypothetical protein